MLCQRHLHDQGNLFPLPAPFLFVLLGDAYYMQELTEAAQDVIFYSMSIMGDSLPNIVDPLWKRAPAVVLDFEEVRRALETSVYVCSDVLRYIHSVVATIRQCRHSKYGVSARLTSDLILACRSEHFGCL
jgi:hypothetical protein